MTKSKKQANPSNSRPTIGYFAPLDDFGLLAWSGIVDAAQKQDVNLICFEGVGLYDPKFWMQANIIYDLVTAKNVDGVVSWATMIGNFFTIEEMEAFHERYHPLPVVTMGKTLEKYPGLLMDSYEGMREAIVHLIEVHGYRRLAFIRGPEDHVHAQGRYQAYVETLEAYDIPLDPNLVTPPAPWTPSTGHATGIEAIRLLLDERGLHPLADLDAIVGASELVLLGAVEALQTRGINIPGEVAVVGFDETIRGQTSTPPLTLVAPPLYEIGYQAAETLFTLMEGGQVPHETIVPSKLIIRQSCGCVLPAVAQVPANRVEVSDETFESALATRQAKILLEMKQEVGDSAGNMVDDWAEQLLRGFATELTGESPGIFLRELDIVLHQEMKANGDVAAWQGAISALRRQVLPYLKGKGLLQAVDLWEQARVTIGEAARRQQAHQNVLTKAKAQTLREIGAALITTFDLAGLMNILADTLPGLSIPSCYLALYDNPQLYKYPHAPEWSRLVLAYTEKGRTELEPDGRRFRSHDLLPDGLWPEGRQFSFVAEPLYFQETQLGFVLFEVGPREAMVYQTLRGQISSALQGAFLVQREEKRSRQLQTVAEVSTATSTILDTADLLQRVVDLTKTRFGLYHVHLYLLNKTQDSLELKAGAGEKGRQMVAQGWSLPLATEKSLVARAARNKQAEIVNNVQANPHWLSNPLLPNTRSELAVPLIAGEQLLGVLDVQADEVDHFTNEDVHIKTTLATQVAVAIKNAQLYHKEAERVRELGQLNKDLETAQAELLRRERLSALGQLTATVAHEIRNPLSTIRVSIFAVDRKTRNKNLDVERALDRIARNITRCDNIITELLDYTRTQELKLQPLYWDEWLQHILAEQTLPEGITLAVDLVKDVEVELEPERFRRAIVNLVDNACQAMQETLLPGGQEQTLHIRSEVVDKQLKISITDTGPGIPPEVMPRIFEPLYSTKSFGVGLGLPIVESIVKQHGGKIEINSEVGTGTQVVVWLPLPTA